MTRGGRVAVVGAALGLGALALWTGDGTRRSAPDASTPAPPQQLRSDAPPSPAPHVLPPSRTPAAPGSRVRAALDRQIASSGRTGRVGDDDRAALLTAIVRVRRSARRDRRRRHSDPAAEAVHARIVTDADALFREKLGVGIAGFIAAQGPPGRIEDLAAANAPAEPAPRR